MANRPTRTALPMAGIAPESIAAGPTLIASMATSETKAAVRLLRSMRQPPAQSTPASSPSAAKTSDGCGPESPMAMGSGGSRSAAPKKSASQRTGVCRLHQSVAMASGGAQSSNLAVRLGAVAMAAAHSPNATGPQGILRACGCEALACIAHIFSVACGKKANRPQINADERG